MNLMDRITIDPHISHGKPTIRGLRYPVESILEYLAAGDTIEDILEEFKDIEREDILACLAYATTAIKTKSVIIMYFIIDAHLPKTICKFLEDLGFESLHTTDF